MVDLPQKEDVKFKGKFRSEFSMGEYHFARYHEILKAMDELAIRVKQFDVEAVLPFYAVLDQYFINIKPIMYETVKADFEKLFAEVGSMVENETTKIANSRASGVFLKPSLLLIKKLCFINEKLLEISQLEGLGLRVERDLSDDEKLKMGLGLK